MRLQTIVYTPDVPALVDWWTAVLGFGPDYRSEAWTTFTVAGATLALHSSEGLPPAGRIAVSLVVDRPLEELASEMTARGVEGAGDIVVQPFGRQLPLRDPIGNVIVVNEHRS